MFFRRRRRRRRSPAPPPPPPPATSGPKVITFGDSYSSGTGIHRKGSSYEGGNCWRDWHRTPGGLHAAATGGVAVNNACKGGEVPDIYQQFEEVKASHPDDAASGFNGSTILFTIGGNDLRTNKGQTWPDLLTSCIMSFYGSCHREHENQIANFAQLQASVADLYTKIVQDAPNARIRVLGYPRLMQRKHFCIPVPGLRHSAADWADDMVDELNHHLRLAVDEVRSRHGPTSLAQKAGDGGGQESNESSSFFFRRRRRRRSPPSPPPPPPPPPSTVDILFVDPRNYFSRGACRISRREVNAIVLDGFSISDSSFHPSQRGYNKYYEALGGSLGLYSPSALMPTDDDTAPEDFQNVFEGWDTNQDGKLDVNEVLAMAAPTDVASPEMAEETRAIFQEADSDKDGHLNLAEFQVFTVLVEDAEGA